MVVVRPPDSPRWHSKGLQSPGREFASARRGPGSVGCEIPSLGSDSGVQSGGHGATVTPFWKQGSDLRT